MRKISAKFNQQNLKYVWIKTYADEKFKKKKNQQNLINKI